MTFETLHKDMVAAMKARDKARKNVISTLIADVKKLCMQMLKADSSIKDSLTGKRQRCAWSFDYALSVVRNFALGS